MLPFPHRYAAAFAGLLVCLARAGAAADYYVPSADHPDLGAAVLAAAASADAENVVYIRASPIFVGPTIGFGAAFHCERKLVIRPDPGVGLRRATIASLGFSTIFDLLGCACVTFRDLDIVRHVTNASDLIHLTGTSEVVFERCRIGVVWPVPGADGFACMRIQYPREVVIRNCLFFSAFPGDIDYGIVAWNFGDAANSLYLYNNTVSDYEVRGVDVTGAALPGPLLVVRNNVVANHPALAAEPVAFRSNVNLNMTVLATHNAVFASAGFGEHVAGIQSISGFPTGTVVRLPRPDVEPAFVEHVWDLDPEWDPNGDFYRLEPAGPLHLAAAGVDVADGSPHARDKAVRDDWERDARPGGTPPHTDRGADQLEAGIATAVLGPQEPLPMLWSVPSRNPARETTRLHARSDKEGELVLELFDVRGRLVHRSRRAVGPGWEGTLECPRGHDSGLVFYRLRLVAGDGTSAETRGRITLVR